MSSFFNGLLKGFGTVIDEVAKVSQQQLHELSESPNWDTNFEHCIPALNERCVEWQRLAPTAFKGEFENNGDWANVHLRCISGKVALVCGDPITLPVYALNQKLSAYMLIQNYGSMNGAWTGRENGGKLDLRHIIRIPLKVADQEAFSEAIIHAAIETIRLQRMLDS